MAVAVVVGAAVLAWTASSRILGSRPGPEKQATMSAKELLRGWIAERGVLVLSKTWCGYCQRAKAALSGAGIKAKVIELDERQDGADIQQAAFELTGQKTVPNVWVNGTHVGGSDKVVAAIANGTLQKLLSGGGSAGQGASPL